MPGSGIDLRPSLVRMFLLGFVSPSTLSTSNTSTVKGAIPVGPWLEHQLLQILAIPEIRHGCRADVCLTLYLTFGISGGKGIKAAHDDTTRMASTCGVVLLTTVTRTGCP